MTEATTGTAKHSGITVEELRSVRFAKAFGRGYEQHEVDAFVDRCAAWIGWYTEQLGSAEAEIVQLQEKLFDDNRGDEVQQAISILTGAQKTADITVKQADVYSTRVMAEARDAFEDARVRTATLEQETDVKVKALWEDASVRAERLEREATGKAQSLVEEASARSTRLEQETQAKVRAVLEEAQQRAAALDDETITKIAALNISSAAEQKELDAQTAYLRTLRDTSRIQMQKFLEGLLDHIAEEYGRAHPVAAEAAAEPRRPPIGTTVGPRKAVGSRRAAVRRQFRIAGQQPAVGQPRGQGVPEPRSSEDTGTPGHTPHSAVNSVGTNWSATP